MVKIGQILWVKHQGRFRRAKVEKVYDNGFDWGSYGKEWGKGFSGGAIGGGEPFTCRDGKRYWRTRKPM